MHPFTLAAFEDELEKISGLPRYLEEKAKKLGNNSPSTHSESEFTQSRLSAHQRGRKAGELLSRGHDTEAGSMISRTARTRRLAREFGAGKKGSPLPVGGAGRWGAAQALLKKHGVTMKQLLTGGHK